MSFLMPKLQSVRYEYCDSVREKPRFFHNISTIMLALNIKPNVAFIEKYCQCVCT